MQKLLVLLSLFTAFQFSSISSMEQPPSSDELSRLTDAPQRKAFRSASADSLNFITQAEAQRHHELVRDLREAISSLAQDSILTPPVPSKPQSLLKKHKKKIIYGGIGLGTLAVAGLAWHLASKNNAEVIEYQYH